MGDRMSPEEMKDSDTVTGGGRSDKGFSPFSARARPKTGQGAVEV
jgi:hypothetical protein